MTDYTYNFISLSHKKKRVINELYDRLINDDELFNVIKPCISRSMETSWRICNWGTSSDIILDTNNSNRKLLFKKKRCIIIPIFKTISDYPKILYDYMIRKKYKIKAYYYYHDDETNTGYCGIYNKGNYEYDFNERSFDVNIFLVSLPLKLYQWVKPLFDEKYEEYLNITNSQSSDVEGHSDDPDIFSDDDI